VGERKVAGRRNRSESEHPKLKKKEKKEEGKGLKHSPLRTQTSRREGGGGEKKKKKNDSKFIAHDVTTTHYRKRKKKRNLGFSFLGRTEGREGGEIAFQFAFLRPGGGGRIALQKGGGGWSGVLMYVDGTEKQKRGGRPRTTNGPSEKKGEERNRCLQ